MRRLSLLYFLNIRTSEKFDIQSILIYLKFIFGDFIYILIMIILACLSSPRFSLFLSYFNSGILARAVVKASRSYSVDQSLNFDSSVSKSRLNPEFVTGQSDAESSFIVNVPRDARYKLGWQVQLIYEVSALSNPANLKQLEDFKIFFKGGSLNMKGNQLYFRVRNLPTLQSSRSFFFNFPRSSKMIVSFSIMVQSS